MRRTRGNIWTFHRTHWVLVPTNVGFNLKEFEAIMGRGLALDAKRRFPDLPKWYGDVCMRQRKKTMFVLNHPHRLVLMPTKPFNEREPWNSWNCKSTIEFVEKQVAYLAQQNLDFWELPITLPLVGCGEGGLLAEDVMPVLERHLTSDLFLLVQR